MGDGSMFWPKHADFEYFSICLNNLHPAIKMHDQEGKIKAKRLFPNLTSIEICGYCSYFTF